MPLPDRQSLLLQESWSNRMLLFATPSIVRSPVNATFITVMFLAVVELPCHDPPPRVIVPPPAVPSIVKLLTLLGLNERPLMLTVAPEAGVIVIPGAALLVPPQLP